MINKNLKEIYNHLIDYMEGRPIINTHSHHLSDEEQVNLDLDTQIQRTYISWCGVNFDNTKESKAEYIRKMKHNSYFFWFQKSIRELYGIDEELSVENWGQFNDKIKEAYKNPDYHMKILKNKCNYKSIILDTYWNPGYNEKHPEINTPTYRIRMYLHGYSATDLDDNGNNPFRNYSWEVVKDIDEYVLKMKESIKEKLDAGCVSLKMPMAYERGLDFVETTKEEASRAYMNPSATTEEIKAFQDYIFFEICKIAAEFDVPVQCHTGLGKMERSGAIWMQEIISKNPNTKFVLFHGSYPWMDDVCGLLHVYNNVYPDLCWVPIISTTACIRLLHELIELGNSDKITWGCDTWTSEESYGALLAARHVFAKVFAEKVEDGYMSLKDSENMIDNIFYNNAKQLYKL